MAVQFQIALAITSILVSLVALYVLIIGSFRTKEKRDFISSDERSRRTRIITASAIRKKISQLKRKSNTRVTSIIWTVLIGQGMGIYFLLAFVERSYTMKLIIKMNGGLLLLASILCSIMTILNAWIKKKMVVMYRLAFQSYAFVIAVLLLMYRISPGTGIRKISWAANVLPEIVIYFYIATVIVALALMLWDALYRKHLHVDYDFSKYYRLVVYIGMFLGLSMIIGLKFMGAR
ncbi:hypothetical protein JW960_24330 [candidate division KSB1 bacterium]|nr:hypothetical protein [candidate division KSB1 bacterium]